MNELREQLMTQCGEEERKVRGSRVVLTTELVVVIFQDAVHERNSHEQVQVYVTTMYHTQFISSPPGTPGPSALGE